MEKRTQRIFIQGSATQPVLKAPATITIRPSILILAMVTNNFTDFANLASERIDHLSSIRIDDEVTALAVRTERDGLLEELAFASVALENLRGLLGTATQVLNLS